MAIKIVNKNQIILEKTVLSKIKLADEYLSNQFHLETEIKTNLEIAKTPLRFEIINFIIEKLNRPITYLEIGVRNPEDNFNKIKAEKKYSVDPGYENEENNVDFKVTSDDFFADLKKGKILSNEILFDAIFIDGSHLADQVEKDITNSLLFLKEDGFIIMHDCNPPTEFHASENYYYRLSPSGGFWNGTTWKAFFKTRKRTDIYSCCVNTDWGVGIISKTKILGSSSKTQNEFFEYHILDENRKESLNLISIEQFKEMF